MPLVTKDQALQQMVEAVRNEFAADELIEVYNEVFPTDQRVIGKTRKVGPLIERLVTHFHSDLPIDEIMDLFHLIFTTYRDLWYDEVEERIHYSDEVEAVKAE